MKYVIPLVVVAIVLAVGTYVEGTKSDRWGNAKSEKLDRFTQLVTKIPKQIDDWTSVDDEINQEEFEASHCTACISRTYTNREGQRVNVYLVSGTGRHVTIHTPDWCYVGAGFDKVTDPQQYRIPMGTDPQPTDPEFLTTVFRKEDPLTKSEIRIFWTFSDDGNWQGPKQPKSEFGGRPAMYKMYLITNVDDVGWEIESNPTMNFAKKFVPTINAILFQEPEQTPAATDTVNIE